MALRIREVGPSEHEEAGHVTADAYRPFAPPAHGDWSDYLDRVADVAGRVRFATVLVAFDGERIVGSLTLELADRVPSRYERAPLAPGEAHVRMLGVDPSRQGHGIGRALMEDAERRARDAGKTTITLNTVDEMRTAMELYRSLGYLPDDDRVMPDGFVMRSFRKQLT